MSDYHKAWRVLAFSQVDELFMELLDEDYSSGSGFAFLKGEGYFFRWKSGALTIWNAHPHEMRLTDDEQNAVSNRIFGDGVSGMVDHETRVVAIEPKTDESSWPGKLTGHLKLIQSILRSLRRYDARITDGYDVRFQSGFSREFGNVPATDSKSVGELMSQKPIQSGERGRTIQLYHGTNSVLLAHILDGGLKPSRETGAKNWGGTDLRHNANAIYLASDIKRAQYYAGHSAEKQHTEGRLEAEPVVLRVTVPTDKLLADDDWLRRKFKGAAAAHVAEWHASLTEFGQVAFVGSVAASAVEVVEGEPSEEREHEFGNFAAGWEGLSSVLQTVLVRNPSLAGAFAKLVVSAWGEDFDWVDELNSLSLSDRTDADELIDAVAAVEGKTEPWEPDEDLVLDRARSTVLDSKQAPDEAEVFNEMLEEEREKVRKERAYLAKSLQRVLDEGAS